MTLAEMSLRLLELRHEHEAMAYRFSIETDAYAKLAIFDECSELFAEATALHQVYMNALTDRADHG